MSRLVSAMQSVFGIPPVAIAPVDKNPNPMSVQKVVPNTDPNAVPAKDPADVDPNAVPAPLAKFEKFWDTPVVDPKAPQAPVSFLDQIDEAKVLAAAGKMDFSSALTPEMLAAVAKGGTDGVAALVKALNTVGQQVYAKSALASAAITKQADKDADARFQRELPKHIRSASAKGSTAAQNAILKNPAIAPIVSALETQALAQYPNASPAEISALVTEYIKDMGTVLNPPKDDTQKTGKPNVGENVDWDAFANS